MMKTWTDDLPVCKMTGVGFQANQKYKEGGGRYELHTYEDSYFHFKLQENICLYGLFDGHDSNKVSDFAKQRLPAELCLGQLEDAMNEADVKSLLTRSFESVERGFLEFIDDLLVQRTNLQLQLPEDMNMVEAAHRYPGLVERLKELDGEIAGGAAAVIVLIFNDQLYVANLGNARALLCTKDSNGIFHIEQISTDHTTKSQTELQYLANIGLNIEAIQVSGKLGRHEITRSLGDYHVKGGYKDVDGLGMATREPVTAEPSVYGGRIIDESFYFLVLISDSILKTLEQATNGSGGVRDIAFMIVSELKEQTTIEGVAQAVVDKVCRIHQDEFVRSNGHSCLQREDMTLVLRLFGARLGGKVQTPVSIENLIQSVSSPQSDIGSFQVTVPYKENAEPLIGDRPPPLSMPVIGSSSSLPSSRVTTPVSAATMGTPSVHTLHGPPLNTVLFSSIVENRVASSFSGQVSKIKDSPDSSGTPENPSCSSGSTPTGFSSHTSDEPEYLPTTQKPTDQVISDHRISDVVKKIEASNVERRTNNDGALLKNVIKDHRESMSEKSGVNSGPRSLNQDDRIDPYVDFTEFFENVERKGGESVVFAEFL